MPDMSSRDNDGSTIHDPGETLELLKLLVRQSPPNLGGVLGQGPARPSFGFEGSHAMPETPVAQQRPTSIQATGDQSGSDPDFRQLSRISPTQAQINAGARSPSVRPKARLADAANDNYARDAQCTTASYDCLSHSWDADYAAACRKAYLACLAAGGYAQQSGTTILFNFPDHGRVILYGDGTSRYIPSSNPPQQ